MHVAKHENNKLIESVKVEHAKNFYEYSKKSKSENTIRAYRFAWKKFREWCGENKYNVFSPPKSSIEFLVGLFISSMAKDRLLKPASLDSYLIGIKYFYGECSLSLNTRHSEIKNAMAGIRRELGTAQVRKTPLLAENIKLILDGFEEKGPKDIRDKALILLGFYGAFRRAELVALKLEDFSFDIYGVSVRLNNSKTDQESQGRNIDIPFDTNESYCPVRALQSWIREADIEKGPVFLKIHKGGKISRNAIGGQSVAIILKKRCEQFGFSGDFSGHSLRAGHVTSAIKAGTPESWIMRQTGHKNINTLQKYIRMNKEYKANSAAKIQM